VEAEVEIDVAQVVAAAPGDHFLLCSDGLTGLVSDLEIAEVVRSDSPEDAARRLVDLANDRGGHDNITVQIAMLPSDETQTHDSHRAKLSERPWAAPFNGVAGKWIAGLSVAIIVVIVAYLAVGGVSSEPEPTTSGSAIEHRGPEQNFP
jgi:protein phosphatase